MITRKKRSAKTMKGEGDSDVVVLDPDACYSMYVLC